MADQELEQLRAKRMAELQAQQGGYGGAGAGAQGAAQQQQKAQQQEEMKNSILSQILDQQARARLNTLAMTKPDKAKMVENHLCQMARSGQLQSKFSEEQLISLLERLSEQTQKKTIVNYDRRRNQGMFDSDSD